MCERPIKLNNGTETACHKCKQCQYGKVKDWVGRNIAQSKTAAASFACTLTYGPELDENRMPISGRSDHLRTALLVYPDVQKFLKYLRAEGYALDFFVTGEKGTEKDRCHWHIVLHFRDKIPTHEIGINFSDRHVNQLGRLYDHKVCDMWPHGFMFWKQASYQDVFYNCKYILKNEDDDDSQRKPGMSKKPPLGAVYFQGLAERYVAQGMAPQALEYSFAEVTYLNKKTRRQEQVRFRLRDRSAEMFLEHYIASWEQQRPGEQRPKSRLVDDFEAYGRIISPAWLDSFDGRETKTIEQERWDQERWAATLEDQSQARAGRPKPTQADVEMEVEKQFGPQTQEQEFWKERGIALDLYREWWDQAVGVPDTPADALEFWKNFNQWYWHESWMEQYAWGEGEQQL